jgi:hypothetical protein
MMENFKRIESFYQRSLDELIQLAASFTFDGTHPLHANAVFLYGSVIELSSSLIPLRKTEHFTAIPIILRSILEAYVDLENLCRDPKYGYALEIKYLVESLKLLKEARNEKNAYIEIVAQAPDYEERVSKMEAEKNRLIQLGYKDLNRYERFSKAGMENEYRTIYNWLCCAAHNDYRALHDRHFAVGELVPTFHFFKEANFRDLGVFFGVAAELLLRASIAIHTLLSSGKSLELQALRAELDIIRGDT